MPGWYARKIQLEKWFRLNMKSNINGTNGGKGRDKEPEKEEYKHTHTMISFFVDHFQAFIL